MDKHDSSISSCDLPRIDELVDQFEDQWLSGNAPVIEEFLACLDIADRDHINRTRLVIELAIVDMSQRWSAPISHESKLASAVEFPKRPLAENTSSDS